MMHKKYKQMLSFMKKKQEGSKDLKRQPSWFLYILQCKDQTFYTGVTNNLARRLKMHNAGKASRYTRIRRPVKLIYQENCVNRTDALIRECAVKALPRQKKEELVNNQRVLSLRANC